MKPFNSSALFIIFLCLWCLTSCIDPSKKAQNASNQTADSTSVNGKSAAAPDVSDLLQLLQGKWQSQQDSTYFIAIEGDKMRHINNGKTTIEASIKIDGRCEDVACQKVDKYEDGWCFCEIMPNEQQCNLVLFCDGTTLEYAAVGAASGSLAFKKK